MKTCRFSDLHYIPAGKTRTETRRTVIVAGAYKIECCPFPEVDGELEYICKMAKVRLIHVSRLFICWSWIPLGVSLFCSSGSSRGGILLQQQAGFIWYSSGVIRSKYVISHIFLLIAVLTWVLPTALLSHRMGMGAWCNCLRLSLLWDTGIPQSLSRWLSVRSIMPRSTRYVCRVERLEYLLSTQETTHRINLQHMKVTMVLWCSVCCKAWRRP